MPFFEDLTKWNFC